MALENRKLRPGTKLVARYKGKDYGLEVMKTEDGVRYVLDGGKGPADTFKSLSSAGSAVTGGACNGWRFWSLAEEDPKPKKTGRKKKARTFEPVAAASDGGMGYYCDGCADAFIVPEGEDEPTKCPKGHKPAKAA